MGARGRVRFELLLDQVRRALPPAPAEVVDAGGGTGQLAVPLARAGYQVTVVDTSAAMLATCAQRAAEQGVAVRTLQGDAAAVAALLGEGSQDAALCHEVAACVDAPGPLLEALAAVLRPGGVLSLAFANRDHLALRAGQRGAFEEALRLLDPPAGGATDLEGGRLATTTAELRPRLDAAGFEVTAVHGVGVFTAARDEDRPEAALLELERRVATREPYRSGADLLHLVALRRELRPRMHLYTP